MRFAPIKMQNLHENKFYLIEYVERNWFKFQTHPFNHIFGRFLKIVSCELRLVLTEHLNYIIS